MPRALLANPGYQGLTAIRGARKAVLLPARFEIGKKLDGDFSSWSLGGGGTCTPRLEARQERGDGQALFCARDDDGKRSLAVTRLFVDSILGWYQRHSRLCAKPVSACTLRLAPDLATSKDGKPC
jgi:hypothetical protein